MDGISKRLTIRPCDHRDLRRIQLIEKESFPDPYTQLTFAMFLLDPRTRFAVACVDVSVVGYVIATHGPGDGSIQSIAVLPGFRGKGIGKTLMKSAMDYLVGCGRVELLVGKTNFSAIGLYRSFGFLETGRVIERYYPSGDDALEFEWKTA